MTITLTPAQIKWLEAEVAAGRFASLDEAAQSIIAAHLAGETETGEVDLDDLDWVKPLLDEAREDVARGNVVSHEEFNAHVDAVIAKLRK